MRGYFGSSAKELFDFFTERKLSLDCLYASTDQSEESEFTLSMLAAEDAQGIEDEGAHLVIAVELEENQIISHEDLIAHIKGDLTFESIEAVFLVSEDGEELTWFARQEIEENIKGWL